MVGGGPDPTTDRTETTYREARAVIESQNDTMSDIDTKAMRTVRFDILLVGLLLTAAQITGSNDLTASSVFHGEFYLVAIAAILLSLILGVMTYNESNLFVGLSRGYIEALIDGDIEDDQWDRDLLRTFAGMISENADEIAWNSWLLTSTQAALVLGVIAGVASVLI